MKDFFEYIYNEVKNKRLDKKEAMDLFRQFKAQTGANSLSEQRFSSTFTGAEFEDETRINIDQCNDQGTILANTNGYSTGAYAEKEAKPAGQPAPIIKKMLFKIDWKEQAISKDSGPLSEYNEHYVILCEMATLCSPEQLREQLEADENLHILALQSGAKQIDKSFQYHSIKVFEEVQRIFAEKADQNVFIQIIYRNYKEQRLLAALSGLLNTARYENSQLTGQLVEIEPEDGPAVIAARLMENRRVPTVTHVRYQDGKRWTSGWSQLEVSLEDSANSTVNDSADGGGAEVKKPWKDKGIYLITGGAGGLGLIFANEIAVSTKEAVVILTGRSPLSPDKLARIEEIEAMGAKIRYEQVDVTDKKGVQKLIQKIMEEYGGLNGVIHSAGFFRDNLITKKTRQEFEEVLAPKVSGLINLDEASINVNLDFLALFSSRAAVNGNSGQADYATANAFMDAYAGYRNNLVKSKQRHGQTMAINWPFWKEGGMNVSAEVEKFWQTIGVVPMETRTGIRALYEGLRSGNDQVIVVVEQIQNLNAETARRKSRGRRPELKGLSLAQCLDWDLKKIINRLLKIPREKIETKKNLMEFGFNSLGLSQLAIQLSKLLEITDLTPAIFFRYSTIENLIEYFLSKYRTNIEEIYQEGTPDLDASSEPSAMISPKRPIQESLKADRQPGVREMPADFMEPIAIIGMSGRFPGARNIEELWTVLANGQDMVDEIPKERFDWRPYYSENQEPGKTVCKWCGCISGVSEFDPLFFEISPREAETMDPQQRLILQESWRALEDAGYGAAQIKREKIGIFVGVEPGDYQYIAGEGNVTSGSNAILAARIAYFLDLHGPVMAIDTACSSGLVAAHQAFMSLRNGECDCAIAAGVRLILTPHIFIGMSQAGMLSADGKCHTFDKRANGMVPGEAVAVVVLKRLSQAEADGDPIYAVIKGSGINYDGKTNGITAPSGNSQIALLKTVYDQYRINPEEIGYIVTHGTGTKLGDPVEINALYDVFKDYTKRQNFCALTSTKTNFGHTMAPSGLVSLISLVQALRHETIPASLHCEQENDYINWQESPFYVNKTNKPWPGAAISANRFQTGVANEIGAAHVLNADHRMGGVSAFGASGTNVHMVIQDYSPREDVTKKANLTSPYYLLALSAKTEESLQEKVKDLIEVLQNGDNREEDLIQISYTLLEGRQHFNHRVAVIVQDREDAIYVLLQAGGNEKMPNLFQGKVPRDFTGHKSIQEYIKEQLKLIRAAGKSKIEYQEILCTLADLYCQGYEIDSRQLYGDLQPRRTHLPVYPFVRENYWASGGTMGGGGVVETHGRASLQPIHPLLHQNTSNLFKQRYSSTFGGRENFLVDHGAMGQKIFPGLAFLEIARAAVEAAVGNAAAVNKVEGRQGVILNNISWAQPMVIGDQSLRLHTGIYPEAGGVLAYEIYVLEKDGETEVVYSQGEAALTEVTERPVLDLGALQAECGPQNLSGAEIYRRFKASGVDFGPDSQGIVMVYAGRGLVLARLRLPSAIDGAETEYVLRPGMMEAVLQAVIGFTLNQENVEELAHQGIQPVAPTVLQALEILGPMTSSMWAALRYSGGEQCGSNLGNHHGNNHGDYLGRLDIDLCDEQGRILVRFKGLEVKPYQLSMETNSQEELILEASEPDESMKSEEPYELMTFEEVWQEQALPECSSAPLRTLVCFLSNPERRREMAEAFTASSQPVQLIFIGQGTGYQKETPQEYSIARADRNTYQEVFRSIGSDYGEIDAVVYMWALDDSRGDASPASARSCIKDYSCIMYMIQGMVAAELRTKRVLLASGFEKDSLERCYLESWIGFERSMGMVLPHTQFAVIYRTSEPDRETAMKDWTQSIKAELEVPKTTGALYQDGKRYQYRIRSAAISNGDSLLKAGGAYLITGGCGGLGFLFAKHLARRHPVNLILSGRSALDEGIEKKLAALEEMGSQVIYLQADVGNIKIMRAKLKQAKGSFGAINGVIHAAGLPEDQFIFKKELEDFEKVLSPKITGTLVLDKLLKEEPLDFVCYFSSSAAILGDFGSCDYAVGNRFLMAYAHYRNRQVSQGLCRGKTVAINWPLWREGGMGFGNDENTKMYLKTSGQRILETEEGVAVFDRILGQTGAQYLIITGQPSRVHRFLGLTEERKGMATAANSDSQSQKGRSSDLKGLRIEQCLEWELKEQIHMLTKISRDKIERDENLADFGFDSISLAQLADSLTGLYGIEITPALFYGYSTVAKLTQFFMENHPETINRFYQETVAEKDIPPPGTPQLPNPAPQPMGIKRTRFLKNAVKSEPEPIAIIGMSGRFPGARNIDELWKILVTGQDMVREIPLERFDWRQYFGDPNEPGKTNCKWCGCIPGVSEFEPLFFEISPKEAETMDPRQRLLLQESWRALEDAGYGAGQIKREKIGMFVGAEQGDYQLLTQGQGDVTSNHNAILASRLAYFLNLNGPVLAINTACSSGLVAAHQAILSLRSGECDTAIAAGVNILLTPGALIGMSQAGMLSEDGKCFTFDKRANGLVPGEAVAAVVLKRLSKAEADGDPIYAVIKGSGINYDGKTNGITAPSGVSQTSLLKTVYEQCRVNPEEIEYIIPHGTGTKLGDSVEINALYDAFKTIRHVETHDYASLHGTPKMGYCALTSTKTNFGHTFAPSGIVSLISLVQALRYETIPASLFCEQENDYINWRESPFYVNKANKPWLARDGKTRTGAVSAFGMSGTNVHMVAQSYSGLDEKSVSLNPLPYYLLVFSAKTPEALAEKIKDMVEFLDNEAIPLYDLSRISYTLLEGRQHFQYRCAVVVCDRENAINVLKQLERKEKLPNVFQGIVPRNFTGTKALGQYGQDLLKQGLTSGENPAKYQEMILALADLYCQGYDLDWKQLYANPKMQRIHLPTYPFARERYWIPESDRAPVETHGRASLRARVHPLLHQGNIWTRIKGYSPEKPIAGINPVSSPVTLGTLLLQADWKEQSAAMEPVAPEYRQHLAILCEINGQFTAESIQESIETQIDRVRRLVIQSEHQEIDLRYKFYVTRIFEEIQNILKNEPSGKALVQVVIPNQGEQRLYAGLSGLLKTALQENPEFTGQLIEVDPNEDAAGIVAKLGENARVSADRSPDSIHIRYQDGKRWVSGWRELKTSRETENLPWKDGGVYLITGGAGGLGLILTSEIARKVKNPTLILTGRSMPDGNKQTKIKELEKAGARIIYRQVDVADKKAALNLIQSIKEEFGALHGLIHAAGVIRDNYIVKKTKAEILEVLAPKVSGLVNLDEACKDLKLDFMILFSSIAGSMGSRGQSDYSAANAFMDAYAEYRNLLVAINKRHGHTLAINWPLWKEGGMRVDPETEQLMIQTTGLVPMNTKTGIQALYQSMFFRKGQVMVLEGDLKRLQTIFFGKPSDVKASQTGSSGKGRRPEMKGMGLEQCLEWDLKGFINRLLKIPRDKVDLDKKLADFGFNSIGLTQLAVQLIKHYGIDEITPALFFKYASLDKLIHYFLCEHQAVVAEFYREEADDPAPGKPTVPSIPVAASPPKGEKLVNRTRFSRINPKSNDPGIDESIAVIGMSGRFPNADTVEELWDNLMNGHNCIKEIPKERWDWREFYGDPQSDPGKTNSKWGGFIAGVDQFDPCFFDISSKEAAYMDPKQRLFLEEAWHCLEDAGYMGERIRGMQCGVYAGVEEGEYGYLSGGGGFINSNQNASLPGRIAYKLDLTGPNLVINASCSSGLVAIHQACQALRQGDCEMALVGGVNLMITPMSHIGMAQAGILSPDGQCYVFDRRANGMAPSEAVALVLLKPLSKAIADQDHIYGCIKASGINYNGKGNGIAAPNPLSQAKLLQDIYGRHHINPESIQYIIPHSLGSKLGDPIEIQVLTDTFAKYTVKKQYCAISSVKPLIGHTFAASGVVSLISMLLAMKHRTILAMHNYETCNEYIDFNNSPFMPSRKNQEWLSEDNQPRIGAISTTGTSGANAHAVIEEYLPREEDTKVHTAYRQIIILSAKNQDSLQASVQKMLDFTGRNQEVSLPDMAYTLQTGREPMTCRLAMVVANKEELIAGLKAYLEAVRVKKAGPVTCYTGDLEHDPAEISDLLSGEAAETIVALFLKKKDLEKIAHYWVKGGNIPWESLHVGETVRRIPLPAYQFAKESYWAPLNPQLKAVQEVAVSDSKKITNTKLAPETEPTAEVPPKRKCMAPRNEIETALAEIFGEVLHIESIDITSNFFTLGGNSTAVMKTLDLINERLKKKVNVKEFYSYSTVEELSRLIQEGPSVNELIDLNREAVLDDDIQPCGNIKAPAECSRILLTGCTGFVGKFLLRDLLEKTEAAIYCLARASSKAEALKRIKTGMREFELWKPEYERRIVPVAGDLSQSELGVTAKIYQDLCNTIDVVYHCATYMNHLATYREMKNTTVDGQKRILRFACAGKQKMIHYISSLAVFNGIKSRQINEMTPIEDEVHYNSGGYAGSKWVADKLMILARERGIPGNIYRLGLVTGDSEKGRYDKLQSYYRLLETCMQIGCYGEGVHDEKTTFTPVDFISNAIVYLANRPEINRAYHLTNPQMMDFIEMIKYYNNGAANPIAIIPIFEFFQRIKEAEKNGNTPSLLPLVRDFLELTEAELRSMERGYEMDLHSLRNVDPSWTFGILAQGGIVMPEIDETLVKRYFDYIAKKQSNNL